MRKLSVYIVRIKVALFKDPTADHILIEPVNETGWLYVRTCQSPRATISLEDQTLSGLFPPISLIVTGLPCQHVMSPYGDVKQEAS